MAAVTAIIDGFEKKIKLLLKSHAELKKLNSHLASEISALGKTVDSQKETIKNLEEKNKIIKLAKSLTESDANNTAEMKYKINEIVREIDKCIAQLNS